MSDEKRLTKRKGDKVYINKDTIPRESCEGEYGFEFCQYGRKCRSLVERKCPVLRVLDKLANCEDLEEQGRLIISPCKVGQIVYPLNADPRFRAFIERIEMTTNGLGFEWVQYDVGIDCTETWDAEYFTINDIGKTVFLDETEYLKALKERAEV